MIVLNMDCLVGMKMYPDNSFDSVVCDPPYELGFMGKSWDSTGIANSVELWREVLRVLKPGGHLLAFSGSRTYHRMTCAIEDAGFEIRDQIMWVYGSGFPKSMNVSKAIESGGGRPEDIRRMQRGEAYEPSGRGRVNYDHGAASAMDGKPAAWSPSSDDARQWEGWGTALKPAHEPICVARKPLIGTVAANVLAHGTGALNIDGCRVAGESTRRSNTAEMGYHGGNLADSYETGSDAGRWPANLIHDGSDEVVALFPNDGNKSAARFFMECKDGYNEEWLNQNPSPFDALTAALNSSRPEKAVLSVLVPAACAALPEGLHCSGLSPAPSTTATVNDLNHLCESVTQAIQSIARKCWQGSKPVKLSLSFNPANAAVLFDPTGTTTITISHWRFDGSAEPVTFSITRLSLEAGEKDSALSTAGNRFIYCAKTSKADRNSGLEAFTPETTSDGRAVAADNAYQRGKTERANFHPTVKPNDLMRYLCRLVTPPGGRILDPFAGSGSTGKAAKMEGFGFIGFELSAEYAAIANARIEAARRNV